MFRPKGASVLTALRSHSVLIALSSHSVIVALSTPRCFKIVKQLPTEYTANTRVWMTVDLFKQYLTTWNNKLVHQQCKILVVVVNCPGHTCNITLTNLTVKFLLPNTTLKLQPCNQGIIQALKFHYRKEPVQRSLHAVYTGKELSITLHDAMYWLKKALSEVAESTIRNYFFHSGFKITSNGGE